jgi:hypothetical protein
MVLNLQHIDKLLFYYLILDENTKNAEMRFQLNKYNYYYYLILDLIYKNEYFYIRILTQKLYQFTLQKGTKRYNNILLYHGISLQKSDLVFQKYDNMYKKY